jgi:cystathionine beta-synthase
MASFSNTLDLIGNTPIVKITKINTGLCELYLKLESQNPGGSIKDRIALSMIEDAESKGILKPGSLIIEATAGNTGIGLALVAKLKGYKMLLVIPDKMSREKIAHLKALGSEIVITRSDVPKGHPDYYQDLALKISQERGGYYINQFENPSNPLAHETGTGPEIWSQMNHKVDAVVVGVGSSGTITGLSRFFKRVSPNTEMVLADPVGSILAEYVQTGKITSTPGSWVVEGIGEDFIPKIADFSLCKKAYSISDWESLETARLLLNEEGLLAGSSSGTLLASALRYCRESKEPKRVLTFICDSGNKYLSKVYNEIWMKEEGFLSQTKIGDLRDLVARTSEDNAVVFVSPTDTLSVSYARMKLHDVSQLPVLENRKVVGIIDESDLLLAVTEGKLDFRAKVSEVMVKDPIKLNPKASITELKDLLNKGFVAILEEEGKFIGMITKFDFINYLRKDIQ